MEVRNYENEPYVPLHFLTVYGRGHEMYIEVGDIVKDGNIFKVGPSVPADMDLLTNIASSIKTENFKALKWKGLLPENVIYCHSDDAEPTIVWTKEPQSVQLYFNSKMGIESGIYKMPRTLFACSRDSLDVFRLDNGPFKKEFDTKLGMMPLPNIYDSGNVCLGSTKKKQKKPTCMEEYILHMENLFYNTQFNALHHDLFGGAVVVKEMKKKDLNKFPFVQPKKVKTLKLLINELS